MAKSYTEFALELGITRQHVGRLAKDLPKELQPKIHGQKRMLSTEAQVAIREMLHGDKAIAITELVRQLERQLTVKDRQIAALQKQIVALDSALQREQEIHLATVQRMRRRPVRMY